MGGHLMDASGSLVSRDFQENGFHVARAVFSKEEIAELEIEFDRIIGQLTAAGEHTNATWTGPEMDRISHEKAVVLHTHNVQQYSAKWLGAFTNPKFLKVINDILGDDVVLHHSKLFQKPAEMGAPF